MTAAHPSVQRDLADEDLPLGEFLATGIAGQLALPHERFSPFYKQGVSEWRTYFKKGINFIPKQDIISVDFSVQQELPYSVRYATRFNQPL